MRGLRPPAAYTIGEGASASGVTVVALSGELDLAAAPVLRAHVDAAAGRALVLDLSEVTFADSAVLKELLRAREELAAREARLVLAGVPRSLRRLLELTGTADVFDEAPDPATAVRQLSG